MAFEDSSETVPWILASNDLIDRLIGVLIDNALKFAGHGGRVEISVSSDGDHATLRVDDSGPGVAMEERTTVFERFHHSDSTSGGTGLGLAIAESIAQITNASYAVTTADLGGARFEFSWRASKA
jgi:signal transduction histidine kinase